MAQRLDLWPQRIRLLLIVGLIVVATILFVVGSLLLAGALLWFGPRVLPLVVLMAGLTTLLDIREVLLQSGRANGTVALLAGGVTVTHAAAAVLAILAWRAYRAAPHPADPTKPAAG